MRYNRESENPQIDFLQALAARVALASRDGLLSAVAVGGSIATGEASIELGADADLFFFGPKARRKDAALALMSLPSRFPVHATWVGELPSDRVEANYGSALVRDRAIIFPEEAVRFLDCFPTWSAVPPVEAIRLLWNRWCETLTAIATGETGQRQLMKLSCDVGTVILHCEGRLTGSYRGRLESLNELRDTRGAASDLAIRAVRERLSLSGKAVLSWQEAALATVSLADEVANGEALASYIATRLAPRGWIWGWLRVALSRGGPTDVGYLRSSLRIGQDPRVTSIANVFSFLRHSEKSGTERLTPNEIAHLQPALAYWRWEANQ